jgi:hypothetical protein
MIATYDISNTMHPYNLSMHTVSQNAHGMHTAVAHGTGDCINDDVFIDQHIADMIQYHILNISPDRRISAVFYF